MKFQINRNTLALCCAAVALAAGTSVQAQQPAAAPANATPAPAAAPAAVPAPPVAPPQPEQPDPKLIKELETILTQKFSRDSNELIYHLERFGAANPATLAVRDRFLLRFLTGDWVKLREELALMPPDLARKIYDKMLGDLTEKQKPNVRLEDVIGLADSVPGELSGDNIRRLGQLLGVAVPVAESYWLADRMQKGTSKLGGTDPAKRLLAARVLIAGGFKDLARTYLPPAKELEKITDEGLRNELLAFAEVQRERETAQRGQVQRIWDENIRAVLDPSSSKSNAWEKTKATSAITKIITQVPQSTIAPVFTDLVKTSPDGAVRLLGALVKRVQSDRNGDTATRAENLTSQANVAGIVAENVKPGEQPWTQIFEMMADSWVSEAENTFSVKTSAGNGKYVLAEDLLPLAPAGKWMAALPAAARDRVDVALSRLILTGTNFDQAADRIVEIGKRSAGTGAALAEDFLSVWAKTHNPQIPEALRKKFGLPEDARIPVTPMMMEKNITSLARMMELFRKAGLAPKDYSKVVSAFDLAYSNAETYRTSHIEMVFGPMDKMDEPLFFLILSRMNENLGERWRKMDVQKAGLTHRDETQTLELVRAGYASALKLIDGWLTGHQDSARALTLAGSLLMDWGDFEYFQDLVVGDQRKRMTGYKEKNLQAQDYFNRGAEAYGKQVPKLTPADYNVDAYIAWFNGLLGIGSNGQVNLSKAMNRAALTKIREHLTALPPKAASAHIGQFAKIVNTRLADEKEPLHEDLKYRYLASSLVITQDDPFTLAAKKKVAYLDELLSEVRMQTRVDGPNTVGRDQDFGIILSIVHTEAMGRAAKFGQYLTNDANAGLTKQQKKASPLVKKMHAAQGPRDELELNINEALSPFFDIKSITFATPDVKPRPTEKAGWDETVLAYIHVRAKDASVDKIPPVQLELKFVDLTGPITIPAESAETVIKVASEGAAPRPASKIDIVQTLDTRQLPINGSISLEIKATSTGLVPELEQLLDMANKGPIGIKNINPHEGLQITELNTWADQVGPRSERQWTIALDGDAVRASEVPIEFAFPAPKAKDAAAVYQTYTDMNLTTLQKPVVVVGRPLAAGETMASIARNPNQWQMGAAAAGGVLLLGILLALFTRRKSGAERPLLARDVFHMPKDLDGFAVVALLRRLGSSPLVKLKDTQQKELQSDLQRVEQTCFGAQSSAMSETDLRSVASKWLRFAS